MLVLAAFPINRSSEPYNPPNPTSLARLPCFTLRITNEMPDFTTRQSLDIPRALAHAIAVPFHLQLGLPSWLDDPPNTAPFSIKAPANLIKSSTIVGWGHEQRPLGQSVTA